MTGGASLAFTLGRFGLTLLARGAKLGHDLFHGAKKMAKLTGKLFACSLAIGFPFFSQTISLLGFSLGCQVVKSTLKMLHTLHANDIIQNVTFMGGAVDVLDKKKSEPLWA